MAINLIIEHNSQTSKINLSYKTITVGRSSKADITLSDKKISGSHCSFSLSKDGDIFLEDLGSTNGTYLNGSNQNRSRVFVGDIINIGSATIRIDEKSLNIREKKALTNSERTSIRFINAPKPNTTEHNFTSPKGEAPSKDNSKKGNSEISINFNSKSINKPSQSSLVSTVKESDDAHLTSSNDHSFKIGNDDSSDESQGDIPDVKEMIDGGYVSTGQTKMIKLDKEALKVQMEKSKRIKSNTKVRRAKPTKKKKPKSLLQKIFSFFS